MRARDNNNVSGQTMLQYAVLIAVLVAAFMGMYGFLRRHIQGSWRSSADSFGGGRQFETGVTNVSEF